MGADLPGSRRATRVKARPTLMRPKSLRQMSSRTLCATACSKDDVPRPLAPPAGKISYPHYPQALSTIVPAAFTAGRPPSQGGPAASRPDKPQSCESVAALASALAKAQVDPINSRLQPHWSPRQLHQTIRGWGQRQLINTVGPGAAARQMTPQRRLALAGHRRALAPSGRTRFARALKISFIVSLVSVLKKAAGTYAVWGRMTAPHELPSLLSRFWRAALSKAHSCPPFSVMNRT